MNKKIGQATSRVITDAAKKALNEGLGSRAIGASSSVAVGNRYTILGVDYRESYLPPRDMNDEEFRALPEEEQQKVGNLRGWFEFTTNNGGLSFSAVLGTIEMYDEAFWTPAEGQTDEQAGISKAEDFDLDKVFRPSARTPEAFIANDCDGLIGKTIRAVGVKEFQRGNFSAKARAFVVE